MTRNKSAAEKAAACATVKRLQQARRAMGLCINGDGEKIYKGGRCQKCWDKKLAGERKRYAEGKR